MKRAILVGAFLLIASRAGAQSMTPIFRLACTAANYPLCGADNHEFNVASPTCTSVAHCAYGRTWDATLMPGAGPNGENVVEMRMIGLPNPTTNDEFYWGWGKSLASQPVVSQGVAGRRFIRVLMRIPSPVNAVGPSGERVGGKFGILGADGTPAQWRALLNWRSNLLDNGDTHDPTHLMFRTERNISAGRIDNYSLPLNTWIYAQLEITPSTTTSSTDASLKMYINNSNRNAPDAQSTGYNWIPQGWGGTSDSRFAMVGYAQAAMTGANVRMQIAEFILDDEWDPNWHPGGSTPPLVPAVPVQLRVDEVP